MKKCPQCGALLSDQSASCPSCASKAAPAAEPPAQAPEAAVEYPSWARPLAWPPLLALAFLELCLVFDAMLAVSAIGADGRLLPIALGTITLVFIWANYKVMNRLNVAAGNSSSGKAGAGKEVSPWGLLSLSGVLVLLTAWWLLSSIVYLMRNNL